MEDRADLYSAIVKLKTSIDELNQKATSRSIHKSKQRINEVYTKLFSGGTTSLNLMTPMILETGLEIFVSHLEKTSIHYTYPVESKL